MSNSGSGTFTSNSGYSANQNILNGGSSGYLGLGGALSGGLNGGYNYGGYGGLLNGFNQGASSTYTSPSTVTYSSLYGGYNNVNTKEN